MKGETTMKKLAMKMLSLLLVLSLLLPTCVFAQPGQDEDGEPVTQSTTSEETTTPTGGGSGEDVDVPTGGGNGDGDADAPTGGGNGEETTKDENGDGDADVSEEEAAPTVVEVVLDEEEDEAYNDELFAAYVAREFGLDDGYGAALFASEHATHGLSAEARAFYDELKSKVIAVANGTATSTTFSPLTKTWTCTWNISELGADAVSGGNLTTDGEDAFEQLAQEAAGDIVNRLLADCPLELFWFNKTSYRYSRSTHLIDTTANTISTTFKGFQFPVALAYRANPTEEYTVTSDLSRVTTAKTNALNIVNNKPTTTTKAQLEYFFEQIIGLVDYDRTAAGWDNTYTQTHYGDPWQLINVFDHTTANEKKVVCEGYAKAFQYLCELAAIPGVKCYSVTGTMSGGNHMWNVVEVGNARYLVDVTNCDDNPTNSGGVSIGYPKNLFMKVTTGSGGTTYDFSFSGQTVRYVYGTDMKDLFCEGYPALRELQSIKIDTPPSKTTYAQGENFDKTGMVVTATYSDGSKKSVTDYTVENGNNLAAGATSVTIKYAELDNVRTETQAVTVTDKPELKGSVTIDKTSPKIGDTLTADTTSLNYNGATAGTLSYQWKADGGNVGSNSDKYIVQVGDYNKKITVTVTNSNNTGSVSSAETAAVVKKDGPSVPAAPTVKDRTADGFTYEAKMGQQYAIITGSPATVIAEGVWGAAATAGGDVVVTGKNANTDYYIYTRVAETDEAYAGAASGGTKVTTRKSAAASEFTYSTKEAVYTGSANGASVTSSVHNSSEFTLKYDGAVTVPTNVGTYALTAVVTAHGDYAATTVELGTWEIKPKTIDVTWGSTTLTYTGLAQAPAISSTSGAVSGETVRVGVKEVTKKTDASPAGSTYTAEAEILSVTGGQAKADNYVISSTTKTQTYTINAATITVVGVFTSYVGDYDGNPHSITVNEGNITTVNNQPITIKYGTASGTYNLGAAPTATDVSESMTVHYKITAPNHKDQTGTATITINKATQTINGDNFSVKVGKIVNLNDKFSAQGTLTYSITGANTTGSSVSGDVLTVGTTTGSFTLKVDAATTGNYNAATKNVTVTVTAKEVQTITAGDVSATYGDTNAKVLGSTDGDGAIIYAVTAGTDVVDVNSSTGALTIKKAGAATVTISAAETSDYAKATKNVTINVAQKNVTITGLGAANKKYDGNNTATVTGTAAVAGKVDSDVVTVTGGTATFADKNVGTGKTVTFSGYSLSGAAAGNYKLTAQPASVTADITAREVTITSGITATNRQYEKDNKTVNLNKGTLTFTNLVTGETLDANVPTTGTVDNANVGTGKNVTYSGVMLVNGSGMASNYKLVGLPTVTVNITQAGCSSQEK